MSQDILSLGNVCPELLQFSDLHLSQDKELMGINCDESFAAVKALSSQYHHIDLTLLTGDISQDHSEASYQKCREVFRYQNHPVAWITGNHDDLALQNELLCEGALTGAKRILFKHWQLVLLNSQIVGEVRGAISQHELDFIERAGNEYPDHHLLLVMHHHPVPMESAWIDQHCLTNSAQLWQTIGRTPQVKGILFGHVHQQVDVERDGVRVLGVPSTSIQFTPGEEEFTVDNRQPGFRHLELLANGVIKTTVHRVPAGKFIPAFDPTGY